jgi:hypothetical protein
VADKVEQKYTLGHTARRMMGLYGSLCASPVPQSIECLGESK